MIEYYESATHLNISFNKHIGTRGWQAAAHMMRKVGASHLHPLQAFLQWLAPSECGPLWGTGLRLPGQWESSAKRCPAPAHPLSLQVFFPLPSLTHNVSLWLPLAPFHSHTGHLPHRSWGSAVNSLPCSLTGPQAGPSLTSQFPCYE